jgi:hypothetical protein
MYSPEDECRGCVADYQIWKQLKVIPEDDILEAQQKAESNDDDWEEEGPDDGLTPPEPKIIFEDPADEDPNIPRNGWGIPLSRETYDEWPSYTGQTIVDIGSQIPDKPKEEEKNDSYVLVTEGQQKLLDQLLHENQHMFASEHKDLLGTDVITHTINTEKNAPVKQKLRYLPPRHYDFVKKEIVDMLAAGIIVPSKSSWASPLVTL